MVIISVFIALPMTFLAKPIINILFGEAYFEAATVLSIHIWTSIFVFLSIASGKWFLAKNLQLISLYRFLVGAITNVILNALLIPSYGAVGSAVALFLSTFAYAYLFDLFHKETRHIFFAKTRALNIIGALFRLFHESKVHFIK
jgi:PST family polysaccharide transporter